MMLRILLGVACLSLLNTSQAEAQLFRRLRVQPQPQPQPQYVIRPPSQPRYQAQPQRYAPQATNSQAQNGYQGQLTATPRTTRPIYLRRADGSIVRYYPNNTQQPKTQARPQVRPTLTLNQTRAVAASQAIPRLPAPTRPIAANQGQFVVRPTLQQPPRLISSVYRPTVAQPAVVPTVPVGVSALKQPKTENVIAAISPASAMPEAKMSVPAVASSIPVNTAATNPAPSGLSLSAPNEVVPASAEMEIQPSPAASDVLGAIEEKSFSVLESIE